MNAVDALQAARPDIRDETLALLDELSAPLSPRQLAAALRDHGIRRPKARRMARALNKLQIIAIVPRGTR